MFLAPLLRCFILLAAGLILSRHSAMAQTGSPVVLTQSGLDKLKVFVGTWNAHGNPDSTGQTPPSAVTTCQWSANGKFLVCDQLVTNKGLVTNNLSIYSYNEGKDTYTLSLVGVPGMDPFSIPIAYKGDELIYSSDYSADGKTTYIRTLNIFSSTTDYIYQVQSSDDGIHWTTTASGQSHKVRPGN
jgi:hypothetical protein